MKLITTGILTILFLSGCVDSPEKKYWKHKDYYIADNPAKTSKTLYLDLGAGEGIARVDNVYKVSVVGDFILCESIPNLVEASPQYWILNIQHDNESFDAEEIVRGPYDENKFLDLLKEYNLSDINWKIIE